MTIAVHDVPDRRRYEIEEDGDVVGFVTYRIHRGIIDFIHTEVDPSHTGRGLAGTLISHALDDARRRELGVLPHCPFVRSYIDAHAEEYLDLVPVDRRAEFGWGD
ncbi:MAG: GNAT family N-acetyltransferase [Acidimicrobiales bacterium]|jgi:predicted GNAT family acetyltransferase